MKKIIFVFILCLILTPVFVSAQSVSPASYIISDNPQGIIDWGGIGSGGGVILYSSTEENMGGSYMDDFAGDYNVFGSAECYNNMNCIFSFTDPYVLTSGTYTILFASGTLPSSLYTLSEARLDPSYVSDQQITLNLPNTATENYLSVPPTISVDLFALAGGLISDFWGLIAIVLGVPLAFYLINKVIDLMPSEKKSKEAIKKADKVIAENSRIRLTQEERKDKPWLQADVKREMKSRKKDV